MSDKKNLDRLFQEKFKDFEATPDLSVWQNIESSLQQDKKNRRAIPLWFKIAGVAAGLVLLFTIGKLAFDTKNTTPENPKTILVDTKDNIRTEAKKQSKNIDNTSVIEEKTNNLLQTETDANNLVSQETENINTENSIKTNTASKTIVSQLVSTSKTTKTRKSSGLVTSNKNKATYKKSNSVSEKNKKESDSRVAETTKSEAFKSSENTSGIDIKKAQELVKEQTKITNETAVASKENSEENKEETTTNDETKPSLEDAVAEAKAEQEEDTINEKEEANSRWSVMPNVAPVYFNTLSEGSSIDEQFVRNDKSGTINMSYGLSASYTISKRWTVRSGINKVNVGYDTNNVVIYDNISAAEEIVKPLRNVALNQASQNIAMISGQDFQFTQVPNIITNAIDSSISQELGFIEVPLEISYKLSDKKFGVNVIGGVSTLFLSKNEIYTTLNGNAKLLGEATNINSTSFSANFGLGLDYKISKSFGLNLEPTFKYQINTFTNTSGNFKPYLFGIYTGFSYKF